LAFWSPEGQVDGVDLVLVGNGGWEDSQRDFDLQRGLALDFLLDWNIDDLDGEIGKGLVFAEGEAAALLPWPEGVVKNFNLFDKRGAWASIKDFLRFGDDLGSLLLPGVALAVLAEPLAAFEVRVPVVACLRLEGLHVLSEFLHLVTEL